MSALGAPGALHPRALNDPDPTMSIGTMAAIFGSIFFLIVILVLACNAKKRRNRLHAAQNRSVPPPQQQQQDLAALERTRSRRLRKQYRGNGPLGWNEQRNGDADADGNAARVADGEGDLPKYGDRRDDVEAAIGRPPPAYQP